MADPALLIRDMLIMVRGFERGIHDDGRNANEASEGESGNEDGFHHALL